MDDYLDTNWYFASCFSISHINDTYLVVKDKVMMVEYIQQEMVTSTQLEYCSI